MGHGTDDVSIKLSKFTYHQNGVGGLASTNRIYIFKPSANTPLAITSIPHEIGHALFGLSDEYASDGGRLDVLRCPACGAEYHPSDSQGKNQVGRSDQSATPLPTEENAVEAGTLGLYTIHKDCTVRPLPQGIMGGGRYGVKSHEAWLGAVNERQIAVCSYAYLGNDVPLGRPCQLS